MSTTINASMTYTTRFSQAYFNEDGTYLFIYEFRDIHGNVHETRAYKIDPSGMATDMEHQIAIASSLPSDMLTKLADVSVSADALMSAAAAAGKINL